MRNQITPRDIVVVELGFVILAFLLTLFLRDGDLSSPFARGLPIALQVPFGIAAGLAVATLFAVFLLRSTSIKAGVAHLDSLTSYSYPALLVIGVCAGIGEEILFRGTIQELIGIWLTSLLFTLAHAQFWALPPMTRGKLLFAASAFLAGVFLGLIYIAVGLVAAILVHACIDIVGLVTLKESKRQNVEFRSANLGP